MTSIKPLTPSERYARAVLRAWNQSDFTELRSAVTQLPVMLSGGEDERVDLIRDLGRNLLIGHDSGQVENQTSQNATLGLLHHLCRC